MGPIEWLFQDDTGTWDEGGHSTPRDPGENWVFLSLAISRKSTHL